MISMREMARRKKGIEAICQMAKAMRLVSTVRFQQLRDRAEKAERSSICSGGQWLISRRQWNRRICTWTAERQQPGELFHHSGSGNGGRLHHCPDPLPGKGGLESGEEQTLDGGKKGAVLLSRRGFEISGPLERDASVETADASPGNCSELTGLGRSERSICFYPSGQGDGTGTEKHPVTSTGEIEKRVGAGTAHEL